MPEGSVTSSSSSNESYGSQDEKNVSYEAAREARPTKRRRTSYELKNSSGEETVSYARTATVSRVKPSKKTIKRQTLANGHNPIISKGKIVDAGQSFETLNVSPWLISSLSALAIAKPTAIQEQCIPKILNGEDVIGGSKTGSGKTVAFVVPILQKWAEDPTAIYAIILTPTRSVFLPMTNT